LGRDHRSAPKNLVICGDGTGNEISEKIANVSKLYRCLRQDRQDEAAADGVLRSWRWHGDEADDEAPGSRPTSIWYWGLAPAVSSTPERSRQR
jgi:hypothetical protein